MSRQADNTDILTFSAWLFSGTQFSNIYNQFVNRCGTYSVSRGTGTDDNTGRTVDQFIFNNTSSEPFELRDDILHFYYGALMWDGDILMYVKIAMIPLSAPGSKQIIL